MVLLKLTGPVWKDVFLGLVPSKVTINPKQNLAVAASS